MADNNDRARDGVAHTDREEPSGDSLLPERNESTTKNAKVKKQNDQGVWTGPRHRRGGRPISEKALKHAETRAVPHHYLLHRPRALQYTFQERRIAYGQDAAPIVHEVSRDNEVRFTSEGVARARERVDLFVDLVWVGIITNLAEVFATLNYSAESGPGEAFLTFIIAFLPAWRLWNFLREFLNSFYMDDALQRIFIIWVLFLAVLFGNQLAYFAEDFESVKVLLITIYLVSRASFAIMELTCSMFIPWLRRLFFINFLIIFPSSGLWVAAIFIPGVRAVGPALAAILWEYLVPAALDTEKGQRLLPGQYRKEVDPIHLRTRMGNFLIITVGEGVLLIVKEGPLGIGINAVTGIAAWSLAILFLLAYMYFAGANSVRYIPAVRKKGWRSLMWISCHIPIFASYITLSASVLYLIKSYNPAEGSKYAKLSIEDFLLLQERAFWAIGTSLSIIIFAYTGIAVLDISLDGPHTLLVNSRILRLIGRPVYIAVILGVPHRDSAYWYMGVCGLGLSLLFSYETIAGLERPAAFFEPKGLTVLMRKELREARSEETRRD